MDVYMDVFLSQILMGSAIMTRGHLCYYSGFFEKVVQKTMTASFWHLFARVFAIVDSLVLADGCSASARCLQCSLHHMTQIEDYRYSCKMDTQLSSRRPERPARSSSPSRLHNGKSTWLPLGR